MSDRRGFLKEVAGVAGGIVFSGCDLLRAAPQSAPSAKRRQVTVGGKRVKTIDVHSHCNVPEAIALMPTPPNGQNLLLTAETVPARLALMDQQGTDIEALSINPFWYGVDRDLAGQIVKIQNQKLAELCAAHPDRFVAFATVALQHPDLAVEQLEEGVKKLGLRGASVGGSVNGEELSSEKFHPFWAKAEELGVLVFMHPQGAPDLRKRLQGNGMLTNVIGNPLDTTIALSHLIFEGTLDRFPGLKLCAAHGGGYLPSYADRSDHGCLVFPQNCNPAPLKKHPAEYLRQLYFDSLVFTPEALRHLVAQCGVSQIVMGTDSPIGWTNVAVAHILGTPSLTNADKVAILGGNAAKLLRIT
jgi:aminocarboxymuconate-semialdehyde decarboxylase